MSSLLAEQLQERLALGTVAAVLIVFKYNHGKRHELFMRLVPVLNAGRDGRIAVSLFCCCCYFLFYCFLFFWVD